ncbi:MAG: dTDP-4-dehydrorhamnose 3,5-epimerase family protein [Deltaproteobacteria bacterium]|jgi:dTDP-4-dehydrorhamnose 3,5-epimerase|nr:dTDP-4-dehydrorhamnose 3,5-epimerase family protein [Deltaproteobacteria bacterium]
MKILSVTPLAIPDLLVIRAARFRDGRGYFTEHFRASDMDALAPRLGVKEFRVLQANESRSAGGVVRGLHFQWSPYMGKLVRPLSGRLVDMALDIRVGSPTLGRIVLYDMPFDAGSDWFEWIWLPPGFAHGTLFPEESSIEYLCTGDWSPASEAGISPLAPDLDWSLCAPSMRAVFGDVLSRGACLSEKDRHGHTLASWLAREESAFFRVA